MIDFFFPTAPDGKYFRRVSAGWRRTTIFVLTVFFFLARFVVRLLEIDPCPACLFYVCLLFLLFFFFFFALPGVKKHTELFGRAPRLATPR